MNLMNIIFRRGVRTILGVFNKSDLDLKSGVVTDSESSLEVGFTGIESGPEGEFTETELGYEGGFGDFGEWASVGGEVTGEV